MPWTADTIPPELTAILDERAGQEHSPGGAVRSCLAEILNTYDELRDGRAPRVPTLPCPACGHTDTSMRSCTGGYSLGWGMCMGESRGHFHRKCPRCSHSWITYDTLDAIRRRNDA